jgi:hypothetical protein
MTDDREPYGQLAHGIYRDWHAEQPGPKVAYWPWAKADPAWRELMMRITSAVAVRAVADAKLRNERLELEAATLRAHLPAILGALRARLAVSPHGSDAKPYRDALAALRGTDEKGPDGG